MKAIEFKTILHNGTVVVPPEYSSQWEGKTIRVIFLDEVVQSEADSSEDSVKVAGRQGALVDQLEVKSSLFSRLKQIKISAPRDFSENIDAYLNGEKNV
jgi:hypothetical protein